MQTWYTWVRDPRTGATFKVTVQAETNFHAKLMFEGQYGAQNVLHLPSPGNG